ncbi:Uncharacterised protein [Mycobacterium tuberculosis]|nr:Uncharacterised protein [Mycobacterium tuberculosis]
MIMPMAGTPMLGRPPSSTPKARLAPSTKASGFQAHLPIGSPSVVSTTIAWNMMMIPRTASRMPSINGK